MWFLIKMLWWNVIIMVSGIWASINCWKCASVSNIRCPNDALLTYSKLDACITWILGNGTVILQNAVNRQEECAKSKKQFWSSFMDLYYGGNEIQSGKVVCCNHSGCNDGSFNLKIKNLQNLSSSALTPSLSSYGVIENTLESSPYLEDQSYNSEAFSHFFGNTKGNYFTEQKPHIKNGFPPPLKKECRRYFSSNFADEWMPKIVFPLTDDSALKGKVGVFYARLTSTYKANDHIIVRLIDKSRHNRTMYTFKLYEVGSVSLFVSVSRPKKNSSFFIETEVRKASVNKVIKLSDYTGYWITVRNSTVSLGKIGDRVTKPLLSWRDTNGEGPRDPFFFAVTTPQHSAALIGINCELQHFHYNDTCVTDRDCLRHAQTKCKYEPYDSRLDQGGREIPFSDWEEKDLLLKSCFCREGHIRIPDSKGCYDPIRFAVTLKAACLSDYHCHSLPNTVCKFDGNVPYYNRSCQCLMGYKSLPSNLKTGLIEGCVKLMDAEKFTILGCQNKFKVQKTGKTPSKTVSMDYYDDVRAFITSIRIKFNVNTQENDLNELGREDIALIKVFDASQEKKKTLNIIINRSKDQISITETHQSSGFFFGDTFTSERAQAFNRKVIDKMANNYVGLWIMYSRGTLSVGLIGFPISREYSIISWADTSNALFKSTPYLEFTVMNDGSTIEYGVPCFLEEQFKPYLPFVNQDIYRRGPYRILNDQSSFLSGNEAGDFSIKPRNSLLVQKRNHPSKFQDILKDHLYKEDMSRIKNYLFR